MFALDQICRAEWHYSASSTIAIAAKAARSSGAWFGNVEVAMAVLDKWSAIVRRRDRHADLFGKMMLRFGMYGRDRCFSLVDGLALGRAANVCLYCQATSRCEAWLKNSGPLAEADKFCPNASLFRELGQLNRKPDIACGD